MNRERIMTDDTDLFYLKFIYQVWQWAVFSHTDFTDNTDFFESLRDRRFRRFFERECHECFS